MWTPKVSISRPAIGSPVIRHASSTLDGLCGDVQLEQLLQRCVWIGRLEDSRILRRYHPLNVASTAPHRQVAIPPAEKVTTGKRFL